MVKCVFSSIVTLGHGLNITNTNKITTNEMELLGHAPHLPTY